MRSMTGYGQGNWRGKGYSITVEVRSVNQRFLEARFNLPREYLLWEAELRQLVQDSVSRGKVDVNVNRAGAVDTDFAVEVNTRLARAYLEGWQQLQRALHVDGHVDLQFLLGRSDLVRISERRSAATDELPHVRRALGLALRAFTREREREGRALADDMRRRVQRMSVLRRGIQSRVSASTPELMARLQQRIQTLAAGVAVSEERLAQEVALLASRGDVTEELVRLASHLDAMRGVLHGREPAGKRLDFLLQEIHREVNTIASKSNDLGITNLTLEARSEVEKLREQAQNVE